jgi:hypothetical protein
MTAALALPRPAVITQPERKRRLGTARRLACRALATAAARTVWALVAAAVAHGIAEADQRVPDAGLEGALGYAEDGGHLAVGVTAVESQEHRLALKAGQVIQDGPQPLPLLRVLEASATGSQRAAVPAGRWMRVIAPSARRRSTARR